MDIPPVSETGTVSMLTDYDSCPETDEKPFLFRGKNGNHQVHKNSLCYIRINIAKSSDNLLEILNNQ